MNEIPAAYVSGRCHIGYVLPDGNQCQRSCHEGRFPYWPGAGRALAANTGPEMASAMAEGETTPSTRGCIAGDQGQHYGNYRKMPRKQVVPRIPTSSVIVDTAIHFKRMDGSSAAAAPDEALYPRPADRSADEGR